MEVESIACPQESRRPSRELQLSDWDRLQAKSKLAARSLVAARKLTVFRRVSPVHVFRRENDITCPQDFIIEKAVVPRAI